MINLVSTSFSTQTQPLFTFLQFEANPDKKTLHLSTRVILSKKSLNHMNIMRVCSFVKKAYI